jgi:hypothetical protein
MSTIAGDLPSPMNEFDLADLFPDVIPEALFGCSGTVDRLERSVSIFLDRIVIDAGLTPPGPETIERSGITSWATRDSDAAVEVRFDDATSHRTLIPAGASRPLIAALTTQLGASTGGWSLDESAAAR